MTEVTKVDLVANPKVFLLRQADYSGTNTILGVFSNVEKAKEHYKPQPTRVTGREVTPDVRWEEGANGRWFAEVGDTGVNLQIEPHDVL